MLWWHERLQFALAHSFARAGKAKILDTVREVVAIHKDRYVFPIKIAVTKVSGTGADSLFMGVLKPAEEDPASVRAWIMTQGTILCVDQRFSDWFGRGPNELVGRPFNTMATEQVRGSTWDGFRCCAGGTVHHMAKHVLQRAVVLHSWHSSFYSKAFVWKAAACSKCTGTIPRYNAKASPYVCHVHGRKGLSYLSFGSRSPSILRSPRQAY